MRPRFVEERRNADGSIFFRMLKSTEYARADALSAATAELNLRRAADGMRAWKLDWWDDATEYGYMVERASA